MALSPLFAQFQDNRLRGPEWNWRVSQCLSFSSHGTKYPGWQRRENTSRLCSSTRPQAEDFFSFSNYHFLFCPLWSVFAFTFFQYFCFLITPDEVKSPSCGPCPHCGFVSPLSLLCTPVWEAQPFAGWESRLIRDVAEGARANKAEGGIRLESVGSCVHTLSCTCVSSSFYFPSHYLWVGNCPSVLECAAFVRNPTDCEMLFTTLATMSFDFIFWLYLFEVESMTFPEHCVNLGQIYSGMRDFCSEVAWRKISLSLIHWATFLLLAGVLRWWKVLPKQIWEMAAACWFRHNAVPVLSSSPCVPEEGLHLILCNSY